MRALGALPKTVVVLEAVGIVFLALAFLSLQGYLSLPAPIASASAAIVMLFIGLGLMSPAAIVMTWKIAQRLAPQLTQPDSASKHSDLKKPKENSDDADH
ncbi:Protein of uncharacterised function (DUF1418) [Cedecea lapagei]|uniref:Protein of uncharacterized function (DUF1418) n=1 Tax=Cedecea lapagei TaxID=158823 RepID=A0A3S4J402_9ENTR|nr:YbjC family protein [Cedecea lapagei]VEB99267.1 Protein of uncharacterised function (DUF1418) [Cedecea lapagei]